VVEHMVIFKFGSETTEEQLQNCAKQAIELKSHIDGIVDIAAGVNFSDRSQGFQLGLTVRFTDRAALEAYTPHPKHQELVAYTVSLGRTDILVVDFEI
jgi:hypothetical protein